MKKFAYGIALALGLITMVPSTASAAPDITDLLKNAASKLGGGSSSDSGSSSSSDILSGLKGAVEGLLTNNNLTEADLVGEYVYSAPAVSLQSENALQKIGGAAATGVIVDRLAPYYEKIGLTNLAATFNDDGTCTFTVKKVTLSGTYAKNEEGGFTFSFKAAKAIPVGTMDAHVSKVGSKLNITFDISKLISLLNAVASFTGQSSIQSIVQLLNSYDGLYAGFELQRR